MPDLIAFAKGVNSGYVPVGGVVINEAIAADFDETVFPGGLTYSGHPLAAASIVASIDAMEEEGIVANAKRIGDDVLAPALAELAEKHPVIGEVRGTGVFWALELVSDPATRAPLARRPDRPGQGGVREARADPVRGRQPHPRGAALRGHRRRGGPGAAHLRRSTHPARRGAVTMTDLPVLDHYIGGTTTPGSGERTGTRLRPGDR